MEQTVYSHFQSLLDRIRHCKLDLADQQPTGIEIIRVFRLVAIQITLETEGRESPAMACCVQSCVGLSPANLAGLAR